MLSKTGKSWHIICREMHVDVDFAVRTWEETGFRFQGRNRSLCSVIVNHTTGAENPPASVFNNMSEHKNGFGDPEPLSVHFVVDKDGVVYQMADTELRAAHCRAHGINATSIGIEYINRHTALALPTRGTRRELVTENIHGRDTRYYDLTLAQLRAGVKLNRMLCSLYGLPFRVPLDGKGEVVSEELPASVLRNYTGCIAHLHAEDRKTDCGLSLLRAIRDAGAAAVT